MTEPLTYTVDEVMNITKDIMELCKEKKYKPNASIHSLILMQELLQKEYGFSHKDLANIKRDCRKFVSETSNKK